MSDTAPSPPVAETPARRAWPAPPGLAATAIAAGLMTAPWAWYVSVPAMYLAACVVAAAGVGLVVATHLTVLANPARVVLAAILVVLLTAAATLVPGWRPGSAGEQATVWRVEVDDVDFRLSAFTAGSTLWLFDQSSIRAIDIRTGTERARIELSSVMDVRPTNWGIAVHLEDDGREAVAGYRPDGSRAWRFTDRQAGDLDLRAVRGGVTAVVACPESHASKGERCHATGVDASGKRMWTRRVSQDAPTTARTDDVRVLLSKQEGRWHFIDPRTGRDFAAPAPASLGNPWVTGDVAVFISRARKSPGCDVVAYRGGKRAWKDAMKGSACGEVHNPSADGWGNYQRDAGEEQDPSYIVDTRTEKVQRLPDVPGDWLGYKNGVVTSETSEDDRYAVYGTELATGDRRWSHTIDDGYALGKGGTLAVFEPEGRPLAGDDYSPAARIVTVYAADTGRPITTTRLAEGGPDDMLSVGDGAVLLFYEHDHLTYVAPP